MEIVKGKRKAKCSRCLKEITTKHRVRIAKSNFHLSCYHKWVVGFVENYKKQIKKLNRYKKYFILEKL